MIEWQKISSARHEIEKELANRFLSGGSLIFLHIPKCAGRTLRDILRRQIGGSKKTRILCEDYHRFPERPLAKRLEANSLRGHTFYGVHKWMREPHVYITLLREPMARVISLYYWMRKTRGHPFKHIIEKVRLEEFLRLKGAQPFVNNVMTKLLSGAYTYQQGLGVFRGKYGCDVSEKDMLSLAKQHLKEEFIFDLVAQFEDVGYPRFKELFGWTDYRDPQGHVNPHPGIEELDATEFASIKERNQLDIALYKHAKNILSGRV